MGVLPSKNWKFYKDINPIWKDDLNQFGNAVIQRLHHYDSVTKRATVDKDLALNKLKEIAPQLFKEKKSEGSSTPQDSQELAKPEADEKKAEPKKK